MIHVLSYKFVRITMRFAKLLFYWPDDIHTTKRSYHIHLREHSFILPSHYLLILNYYYDYYCQNKQITLWQNADEHELQDNLLSPSATTRMNN